MKTTALGLTTILVLASGSFGPARADSAALLVPGYEAAKDIPGARELPDPRTDYKPAARRLSRSPARAWAVMAITGISSFNWCLIC